MSEGQAPSANPAASPEATEAQPTSARVDDAEVLRKEIAALRRENAKYRTRNDEETQQKLKEQGDYKALFEKAAPDLEKAKRYDAFVEREQARIEREAQALPPSMQKALAKAGSLEDRLELLEDFKAELQKSSAPRTPPAAPAVGAPPAARKSLNEMSVEEYEALKRSDPEGFRVALSSAAPRRHSDVVSRYQPKK